MIVVPALLFVVPALFGHPAIDADNLIQNFPLRVLSGRQIASGHFPLLDPYANSGTPLLGGLNAGALYPLTVIFAFVAPIAAWVFNLIAVYVIAAVGMFALLRWHGLRTLSSFAAAMSFTYTGAMLGQIVHLGVVQGFAFIPWVVLALLTLSRRLSELGPSVKWRWYARTALSSTVGFALLWGLTFLTGEPRAIAEIELLTLVSVPVVLVMRTSYSVATWRARVTYVVSLAVGLAWGAGIGLVQLLPGWSFIGSSQRSVISYWYFGAGSLAVRRTSLLLLPDMFGGNGILGQPGYFVDYNLAEVTGYAGLLALVATVAFLVCLARRGGLRAQRDYVLYLVIGVVGLFAAWGNFTTLGHVFRAIPLFGSTRLQSRNIILVDFAVSVLLGWWLDRMQARDSAGAGVGGRTKWIILLPAFGAMTLSLALLIRGTAIVHFLGASVASASKVNGEILTLSLHLLVAAATVVCLLRWRRLVHAFRWLLGILALDVVVFVLFSATGLIGGSVPVTPSRASAVAVLGSQGRFALVDESGAHHQQYQALGSPNLNVFTKIPSVQGYGSLISTIYDNSTGTHPLAMLDPCRLASGTFTQLRLASIAVSSTELSTLPGTNLPPTGVCLAPRVTPSTQRYFGQLLDVRIISVSGHRGRPVAKGPVTLQLLDSTGKSYGPQLVQMGAKTMHFRFSGARDRAAGFTVSSPSGVSIADATVRQRGASGPSYRLDTAFQLALSTSSWRLASTVGTFAIFRATHVLAPEWIEPPSEGSRIHHVKNASWGDAWVSVTATKPVVLVRSMAYLPGWRATAVNDETGQKVALPVTRTGLVQQITVPRGRWTVHFHYHAPYIELGVLVFAASGVAFCGAVLYIWFDSRRRRNAKVEL